MAPSAQAPAIATGQSIDFQVSAADQDANLKQVDWYVNTGLDHSTPITGSSAPASWNRPFPTAGTFNIGAVAVDTTSPTNLTAELAWVVTVTTPPVTPVISEITPNPLQWSSDPHTITINGSNFLSGCTVTLRDVTNNQGPYLKSVTFINSGRLQLSANFTNNTATWSAQVTAPTASNTLQFEVQASAPRSPSISGVTPATPLASDNPQPLKIAGTNFVSGATVTLRNLTTGGPPLANQPISYFWAVPRSRASVYAASRCCT